MHCSLAINGGFRSVDNFIDIPSALTIHRLPMLPNFRELPTHIGFVNDVRREKSQRAP